jgi:hypothetical protein
MPAAAAAAEQCAEAAEHVSNESLTVHGYQPQATIDISISRGLITTAAAAAAAACCACLMV